MAAGSQPTYRVRHVKNVLIPTRDGTRLAADLFLPISAGTGDDSALRTPHSSVEGPFPAILEYLPYQGRPHRPALG